MPTDKQKASIETIFKAKKKRNRNWVKDFDEDKFIERGDLDYLNNRELKEVKDILERGGYERLG